MFFIRAILCTLAFIIFGLGAIPLNIFLPVCKKFMKGEKYIFFSSFLIQKVWRFFTYVLIGLGLIRIDFKDIENIKNIKNKIIVATHPSFIDVVVLLGLIPKTTCFVKQTLKKNLFMGNIVKSIFISNDVEIEDFKKEIKEKIDLGFNILFFPMGTRHRSNEHPKIKKGASLAAFDFGIDIVPIKIIADGDFIFSHQPFYSADKKIVNFKYEICPEIKIENFKNLDEIKAKKEITNEITLKLYN